MTKLSSQDFDTTKIFQLIYFACDEGNSQANSLLLVKNVLNDDQEQLISYYAEKRIRLAWSLIKCGVDYHNGRFHPDENLYPYGLSLDDSFNVIFARCGIICKVD
jgi:hypothetical protein